MKAIFFLLFISTSVLGQSIIVQTIDSKHRGPVVSRVALVDSIGNAIDTLNSNSEGVYVINSNNWVEAIFFKKDYLSESILRFTLYDGDTNLVFLHRIIKYHRNLPTITFDKNSYLLNKESKAELASIKKFLMGLSDNDSLVIVLRGTYDIEEKEVQSKKNLSSRRAYEVYKFLGNDVKTPIIVRGDESPEKRIDWMENNGKYCRKVEVEFDKLKPKPTSK